MSRALRSTPVLDCPRAGGSMAGLFLILGAVTMMVVLVIMMGKGRQQEAPTAPTPEPVDPFAHMSYSEDESKASWDDAGAMSAAEVDALLASVEFEDKLSNWEKARDLQAQAKDLMAAFQEQRNDGDPDWREKAKEAKTLYEEALQRGEVYCDALAAAIGEDAYQSKRMDKLLQAWRRDLMGLRKTVK